MKFLNEASIIMHQFLNGIVVHSNETRKNDLLSILSAPFAYITEQEKRILNVPDAATLNSYQMVFARAGADSMKLLINYHKAKLAQKGISWNCVVIEYGRKINDELNRLLNMKLELGASYRIHLLVQQMSHFSNMDIKITSEASGNKMSIALLDAATSWQYKLGLLPAFIQAKDTNPCIQHFYYTDEAIQKDDLTCPIISYLLAKNINKIADFHEVLAKSNPNDGPIKWQNLPNSLLKQAQSFTFVDSLGDKKHLACNKKQESLLVYVNRHHGFYSNFQSDKRRNFAAIDSYIKNAKRLREIISSVPADKVVEMIESGITLSPHENSDALRVK